MNEPWGIAGPDFLRIYLVAFAFALLFALAVRIMVRAGSADSRAASGAIGPGQLTVDELACLAGGARRVVETAVARLIDRDKVRPSRKGTVRVVEGSTATDPIDQAVMSDIRRYHERSIGLLVDKVGRDDAVRKLGEGLARKGLLVGEDAVRARWCVLPLTVLFVVGGARWTNGLAEGRPIGWLTLALVATAVMTVLLYRKSVPALTYAGERVLAEARGKRSRVGDEAVLLGGMAGVVGVVALSGLAAHPDTEVAMALEAQKQAMTESSASSGSGCGSGSSSGAGSSCGGGGSSCGGGGGCGG
ncbi:TIGR04222 domain-containing membrane protein [Actinokineospora sp.]|uniref:TIGR04222 domain-containing membrane protein n=1 Tax=Actinokineospora sp. TaxID=1872133 RepID=UPI003D6B6622